MFSFGPTSAFNTERYVHVHRIHALLCVIELFFCYVGLHLQCMYHCTGVNHSTLLLGIRIFIQTNSPLVRILHMDLLLWITYDILHLVEGLEVKKKC